MARKRIMTNPKWIAWTAVAGMRNRFEDPENCQLCGVHRPRSGRALLGHHWKGYEFPADVWWLCDRCHTRLRFAGVQHDGQTTLEKARELIGAIALQLSV
jgi:hypothetical protein